MLTWEAGALTRSWHATTADNPTLPTRQGLDPATGTVHYKAGRRLFVWFSALQ